ncbi:cupin domain-containing protein, partial [Leifsonia sp. NPDC058292]|uniref:cupin domain-containing protein n=1 Tax=Leifsonia sp. NPDC058292 TaxID=3346428 RepID=UPI0036D8B2BF
SGDRPALSRCLAIDPDAFAAEYWAKRPLLTTAAELTGGFDDLFSRDAADELVSSRALRTPFVRMAKEGTVLPPTRYTAPGGFGAEVADQVSSEKVLAEFANGATLVLQGLHRTWPPIAEFARRLAAELGHPCQVNAYITPASSRGFDPHYDVHDVFVLQIHGEKHWVIHEPVHQDPLRDQPWSDHRDEVAARAAGEPAVDATFRPGDVLYLPRGWIHSATALGGISIHLTIGVAAYTRHDIVREAIARAADTVELRASLPLGFDPSDTDALRPIVEATIADLIASLGGAGEATTSDVADRLTARRQADSPPGPVLPLATIEAVDVLDAGDASMPVVLRSALPPRLVVAETTVSLRLPTKTVTLPIAARAAVERLLTGVPIPVAELPDLDADSAVVVARRLLREGVIEFAGDDGPYGGDGGGDDGD